MLYTNGTSSNVGFLDESVDRSNVMLISQFLTSFQLYYSLSSKEYFGPISPDDVVNVMLYRNMMISLENLKHRATFYEFNSSNNDSNNKKNNNYVDQYDDENKMLLEHIEESSKNVRKFKTKYPRIYKLEILMQRFEVWSTKAISHNLLISHNHPENEEFPCWSALLNVPTAHYSKYFLPEVYGSCHWDQNEPLNGLSTTDGSMEKHHSFAQMFDSSCNTHNLKTHQICSLAITPSVYTWQEYVRLTTMVSQLPNDEALHNIHRSLLCGTSPKSKDSIQPKHLFNPIDLVALWIRAQRNSQARRHLINLFRVTKSENMTSRKYDCFMKSDNYYAEYRGNHKLTQNRVVKESKLVDLLVDWAVTKQVLCRMPIVLKELIHSTSSRKRRQRSQKNSVKPRKKCKITNEDDSLDQEEKRDLLRACQSYLLRSFSRRNRRAISFLFYKDNLTITDEFHENDTKKLNEKLSKAGVHNVISCTLESTDRLLPRIDRRIFLGKYDSLGSGEDVDIDEIDLFYISVKELLEVFVASSEEFVDESEKFLMINALRDFDQICNSFNRHRKKNGLIVAARSLLDSSSNEIEAEDLASILSSIPPPWIDRCSKCEKSVLVESSAEFRVCAICNSSLHVACGAKDNFLISGTSAIRRNKDLRSLYTLSIPSDATILDFRGRKDTELQWKVCVVNINRTTTVDGTLERYGLTIRQTEECEIILDQILKDDLLVDVCGNSLQYPLGIESHGSLVVEYSGDSCAFRAGLKQSDVIVGIKILEFENGKKDEKYKTNVDYLFSKLNKAARLALFRLPIKKMQLTVRRPSIDLVTLCNTFVQKVTSYNLPFRDSFHSAKKFWYCEKCVLVNERDEEKDETTRVEQHATISKAIIRQLVLELESTDFSDIQETTYSVNDTDSIVRKTSHLYFPTVSLARLEEVMDSILNLCNSKDSVKGGSFDSLVENELTKEFFEHNRWIPDGFQSQPYSLLCAGVKHITLQWSRDKLEVPPPALTLLRHFLRLFTSWIYAADISTIHPFRVSGPSKLALNTRRNTKCDNVLSRDEQCPIVTETSLMADNTNTTCSSESTKYVEYGSFVGKILLVLPGDPLLIDTMTTLQNDVQLEHLDRPVEFLVAGYVPHMLEPLRLTYSINSVKGTFYLVPLINQIQLQFLLKHCTLEKNLSFESMGKLKDDIVCTLRGVSRVTGLELQRRLEETERIYAAISHEIAKQAQYSSESNDLIANVPKPNISSESPYNSNTVILDLHDYDSWTARSAAIIRNMITNSDPMLREMSRAQNFATRSNDTPHNIVNRSDNGQSCLVSVPIESTDGRCRLIYTDLWFYCIEEKEKFERNEPDCSSPKDTQKFNVELSRKESDKLGWGLEILHWTKEQSFKIGRVMLDSPAWRAGIRRGDILLSVNGISPSIECPSGKLTCDMLNIPKLIETHLSAEQSIKALVTMNRSQLNTAKFLKGAVLNLSRKSGTTPLVPILNSDSPDLHDLPLLDLNGESSLVDLTRDRVSDLQDPADIFAFPGDVREHSPLQPHVDDFTHQIPTVSQQYNHDALYEIPIIQYAAPRTSTNQALAESNMVQPLNVSIAPESDFYHANDERVRSAFILILAKPFGRQAPLCERDLYQPGPEGTIFTFMETSLLLESIHSGYPLLGLRMLCPRYTVETAVEQLRILTSFDNFLNIPRIAPNIFNAIIKADYSRSSLEHTASPTRFIDTRGSNNYSYKMPEYILPIDRLLELHCNFGFSFSFPSSVSNPLLNGLNINAFSSHYYGGNTHHQNNGDSLQRIRGGGGSSNRLLREIEEDLWDRTLVYSDCKTTLANVQHGTATLLGYVDATAPDEGNRKTHQPVRVFYLSNIGIMSEVALYYISTKKLCIVERSSEKKETAEYWVKKRNWIIKETKIASNESNLSSEYVLHVIEEKKMEKAGTPCIEPITKQSKAKNDNLCANNLRIIDLIKCTASIQYVGQQLLNSLYFNTTSCHEIIGELVDGRKVVWFQNDPKSLYLAPPNFASIIESSSTESTVDSTLLTNGSNRFKCIWGCQEFEDKRIQSAFELRKHMQEVHSIFYTVGFSTLDKQGRKFSRLDEGSDIMKLLNFYLSEVSAKYPKILEITNISHDHNKNTELQVVGEKLLEAVQNRDGSFFDDSEFTKFFLTATKIFCLFKDDGKFRFNDNKLYSIMLQTQEDKKRNDKIGLPLIPHEQQDKFYNSCQLCDIGTEHSLVRVDDDENSSYRGCGCTSLSSWCVPNTVHHKKATSSLGFIKNILIHIADKMPDILRTEVEIPGPSLKSKSNLQQELWNMKSSLQQELWNDDSFRQWKIFVNSAYSINMLVQAFIVLLASIQKQLLPTWWSDEVTGWSNSTVLACIKSSSELTHHALTFDQAVTEYVMVLAMSVVRIPCDNVMTSENILTVKELNEKVKIALQKAKQFKIRLWDEPYDTYCTFCEDGGELICCDMCSSLWHLSCCRPELKETPARFVCESCRIDLSNLQ